MLWFNSLQLTILFCAYPFIIDWVSKQTFPGAGALYYVALAAYLFQFGFTVVAYTETLDKA